MLTRTGLGVILASIACATLGLAWHYEELVVLAVAGLVAVALAVYLARRPARQTARRRLLTARVARGVPVRVRYQLANPTRRRLGPIRLIDEFQSRRRAFQIPSLPPLSRHELECEFASNRRGIFEIGPLAFERSDQLGLATTSAALGQIDHVVVHPRVFPLVHSAGAGSVIANDAVLRRPSGDPLAGFQSLREYQHGDDTRLIHWPTSARTATLMVREFVDLRRREFTVLVDTSPLIATEDEFEEIVDVAASVAVFALESGLHVVVRTTSRQRPGRPHPLDARTEVLDLLTPLQQGQGADVLSISSLFTGGLGGSSVMVITGPRGPSTPMPRADLFSVARIGAAADTIGLTCPALAATDAAHFVDRWAQWS